MTISDGLPIQFWPTNCKTYNETVPPGIFAACYNQVFECDDEIRLQFKPDGDSPGQRLLAADEWTPIFGTGFVPPQASVDETKFMFNHSNTASITKSAYMDLFLEPGDTIAFNVTTALQIGSSMSVEFVLMDLSDVDLGPPGAQTILGSATNQIISLTAGVSTSKLRITYSMVGDVNNDIQGYCELLEVGKVLVGGYALNIADVEGNIITSIDFEENGNYQNLAFVPADLSPELCDQKVQFIIVNPNGSPEEIAKSDFIELKNHVHNSVLIKYSNVRAYAGIAFSILEPGDTFSLRIPAIFFHERFPGEGESQELSRGQLINVSGVLRSQKLLDTGYMPYYMHKKIQLTLNCQYVEIDGQRWTKQEAYEIQEGNKRHPLKRATCWLTDRGFVARNVI